MDYFKLTDKDFEVLELQEEIRRLRHYISKLEQCKNIPREALAPNFFENPMRFDCQIDQETVTLERRGWLKFEAAKIGGRGINCVGEFKSGDNVVYQVNLYDNSPIHKSSIPCIIKGLFIRISNKLMEDFKNK